MKKNLKFQEMLIVNFDKANNFYELEFQAKEGTYFLRVDGKDHERAAVDEFYFDNQELVEKLIADADEDDIEFKPKNK